MTGYVDVIAFYFFFCVNIRSHTFFSFLQKYETIDTVVGRSVTFPAGPVQDLRVLPGQPVLPRPRVPPGLRGVPQGDGGGGRDRGPKGEDDSMESSKAESVCVSLRKIQ